MRIKKIEVKKLFGIFNHAIQLKMDDRITIMHGPNGIGKTVLLTMLSSIFRSEYGVFSRIPFVEFSVVFENDDLIKIKKDIRLFDDLSTKQKREDLVFELIEKGKKTKFHTIKMYENYKLDFPISIIEDIIPEVRRIGAQSWQYLPTQELLNLPDILERFGDLLPEELRTRSTIPPWIKELSNRINVYFIETQRLFSPIKLRRFNRLDKKTSMTPSVLSYSEELVSAIQEKLSEYGSLSQSLDRTFPTRLVKGGFSKPRDPEQLKNELKELEDRRNQLVTAGLLDKDKEMEFRDLTNIDETNKIVLSVYIDDVKKKLGVLDDLTRRIDLLINIVNSRFLYKKMSVSKKGGFTFLGRNEKQISAANLSSGEQHELVLFYELLFKVKPDSLILVDEPELSLHVYWQQQFLSDMQEIIKLSKFDLLLATHSPSIIQDRWDLTVELKGPEDVETSRAD
ncbi:MAG TPA: AAA family ATPase [Ignavibacteriaceae bacterium]|nr:AAA family ATPase [Ignavibacteriaceae bacterium]